MLAVIQIEIGVSFRQYRCHTQKYPLFYVIDMIELSYRMLFIVDGDRPVFGPWVSELLLGWVRPLY